MLKNPLLKKDALPLFKNIQNKHIEPAVDAILQKNRLALKKLLKQKHLTWDNFMLPLSKMSDELHRMWSSVSHLNSVMDSEALRKIYERCLPKIVRYEAELDHNTELYRAIGSIKSSAQFKHFNAQQRRIISHYLRDFKLAGITLSVEKKKELMKLEENLSQLATQFSNHLLDATDSWHYQITNKNDLAGLPTHIIEKAKVAAQGKRKKGWLFGLDMPTYQSVMLYAENQKLRKNLYVAYVTRASELGPNAKQFDNTKIIEEILSARLQIARLVGFQNFADYSLATKMAKNSNEVLGFLNHLSQRSSPAAKKEVSALKQFAKKQFGVTQLNAWDIPYYSEKLKGSLFHLSQEQLRPYFPEEKVLFGLFNLVEKLFGITIKEKENNQVWHKDVKYFQIYKNKKLRGGFYIDLYARPKKRGGAWMEDGRSRYKISKNKMQFPVAYLTCNFSKPTKKHPSLLTHEEVITLFHEFGHCLQHLLTQVDYLDISGIHGVEWDAIELSSQLMENFCWQPKVIAMISSHYKTGSPLPDALLSQLLQSKHFQSGLQMLRQLAFALFDFKLHVEFNPRKKNQVQKILNEVRRKTSVFPTPSFNRFQHSFSHIFAGGYAAGYYSYKWAEVLSSDGFEKFESHGVLSKKIGREFLKHILETGGSEDAAILFKKFRGRKPKIDALLRYSGIANSTTRLQADEIVSSGSVTE